ncbi:MAG: hypothetical protein R3D98_10290 [Candidatus Krumholzibacteriia bacterium]
MARSATPIRRSILSLAALLVLLLSLPASAQYLTFPRIGVSAAPDRYVSEIDVHGDATFELYVVALPPEDQSAFAQEFGEFQWAVLEACCGGAAAIVAEDFNPACEHVGSPYGGVVTTSEVCMSGEAVWLCTLTLQMVVDQPGRYYVVAGPLALAQTCGGEGVVMTDLLVDVNYTTDVTPVETLSLSRIKALFD